MADIKVKQRTKETAFGQFEVFTAILPTGRIVGQIEVQIPLEPGYTIAGRVGQTEQDEIMAQAKALALRIGEAVETVSPPRVGQ